MTYARNNLLVHNYTEQNVKIDCVSFLQTLRKVDGKTTEIQGSELLLYRLNDINNIKNIGIIFATLFSEAIFWNKDGTYILTKHHHPEHTLARLIISKKLYYLYHSFVFNDLR